MGERVFPVVAVWLATFAGCDRPPAVPPTRPHEHPAEPGQPEPLPIKPAPAASPEPAPASAPGPRFVTPADPDIAPLPPTIIRATGKRVRRDLGDGWTVRLEPAEMAAAPGDELEFNVELRNRKPGSGRPSLSPSFWGLHWPDLPQRDGNDPSHWLPLQGGRTRGRIVAGPNDWVYKQNIYVGFSQRQRPGSLGHTTIDGPRIKLDVTTLAPVDVRIIVDRCDLPEGLAVTVEGRRVTAFFTAPMSTIDAIRPRGDFVLRRIAGRLTLVGFVEVEHSDFITGAPQGAPCPQLPDGVFTSGRWLGAVEATFTSPEPGPVDVVFYVHHGGFNGCVRCPEPRHATAVRVE